MAFYFANAVHWQVKELSSPFNYWFQVFCLLEYARNIWVHDTGRSSDRKSPQPKEGLNFDKKRHPCIAKMVLFFIMIYYIIFFSSVSLLCTLVLSINLNNYGDDGEASHRRVICIYILVISTFKTLILKANSLRKCPECWHFPRPMKWRWSWMWISISIRLRKAATIGSLFYGL